MGTDDPHWEQSVGFLVERLSMTWGGSTGLIVPVDESGAVHDALWRLVEVYDADIWGVYLPSWSALQRVDPTEFDQRIAEQAEDFVQAHGGVLDDVERQLRDEVLRDGPWTAGGVHEATERRLRDRTGISTGIDGHLDCEYFFAGGEESNTLHVTRVRDLAPLPSVVNTLDLSNLSPTIAALVHSRTGHLSDADCEALKQRGVSVEAVVVDDPADLAALLAQTWGTRNRLRRTITDAATGTEFDLADLSRRLPYRLAELGCALLTRMWAGRLRSPQTLVVGDTLDDFAYAHAHERCAGSTVWLPTAIADDPEYGAVVLEQLGWWLWSGAGSRADERPRLVGSCSLGAAELEEVVAHIRDRAQRWMPLDVAIGLPDPPPFRVPQLFDARHYDLPIDEPFNETSMARGVPAQTPSIVTSVDPSALKWWVDVNDGRHQLPARTALNRAVVKSDSSYPFEIVRSGRDAVSFASHTMGLTFVGARLEDVIVRPRLRFPDAHEVFEELLAGAGVSVQLSDKGQYQQRCIELWGEPTGLAEDLAAQTARSVLDGWLVDLDKDGPGTHDGVRRFLSFADCQQLGGGADEDEVRTLLTRYLRDDIVRRGFVLRCKRCSSLGWYPLEQVAATFQCRRCWTTAVPDVDRVPGAADDLRISYELNEAVYQFLHHNGAAPVSALQRIRKDTSSFLSAPELVLTKDQYKSELDVLAIGDGRIYVGEVKTTNRLGPTAAEEAAAIKKVLRAAEAVTADVVVFGTTKQWRPDTRKLIDDKIGESPFEAILLEQL